MGAISLIALLIAAIAFSAGGILVGKILVKGSKNPQKGQAYECGIPTDSSPWHQFNVGYYLFALLFLIFDVELVFLAVVVKKVGMVALIEIIVFIFILFMGFLYAHKKGALKWS